MTDELDEEFASTMPSAIRASEELNIPSPGALTQLEDLRGALDLIETLWRRVDGMREALTNVESRLATKDMEVARLQRALNARVQDRRTLKTLVATGEHKSHSESWREVRRWLHEWVKALLSALELAIADAQRFSSTILADSKEIRERRAELGHAILEVVLVTGFVTVLSRIGKASAGATTASRALSKASMGVRNARHQRAMRALAAADARKTRSAEELRQAVDGHSSKKGDWKAIVDEIAERHQNDVQNWANAKKRVARLKTRKPQTATEWADERARVEDTVTNQAGESFLDKFSAFFGGSRPPKLSDAMSITRTGALFRKELIRLRADALWLLDESAPIADFAAWFGAGTASTTSPKDVASALSDAWGSRELVRTKSVMTSHLTLFMLAACSFVRKDGYSTVEQHFDLGGAGAGPDKPPQFVCLLQANAVNGALSAVTNYPDIPIESLLTENLDSLTARWPDAQPVPYLLDGDEDNADKRVVASTRFAADLQRFHEAARTAQGDTAPTVYSFPDILYDEKYL